MERNRKHSLHKKTALLLAGLMTAAFGMGAAAEQTYPESLDPRPDGVSAIREQYWGTCWDLGGIATLETSLIKAGLADSSIELSAEDVLWWSNQNTEGGWTNQRRDDGGYAAMTVGYMETVGVRSGADIPYFGEPSDPEDDTSDFYGEGENTRPENYDTAPVLYDVTDIVFLEEGSIEALKDLITKYGAVTVSYRDGKDVFREDTGAAWAPYDAEKPANHTVSLVGWDDNFPTETFVEIDGKLPEQNGAWLVKNSYGTEYGPEGGFIHLSYGDGYMMKPEEYNYIYAVAGAREAAGYKRYIHDQFGPVTFWEPENDGSNTYAAVYEFGADERLAEVSFATMAQNAQYEIYYAPVEDGVPSADASGWKLLAEGEKQYAGYYTEKTASKEAIPEGKGAIILKLTAEHPSIGTDENLLQMGRPMFNAKADENSSFILKDGSFAPSEREKQGVGDIVYTENVDFCLRAATEPVNQE